VKVSRASVPDVFFIEPRVINDSRGFFMESWSEREFEKATGLKPCFVQDNHSRSRGGVLRGLHYQVRQPQGKLVRVVRGATFDVCVDLRPGSDCFGRWVGIELSDENHRQIWIPPGFAHGFLVLTDWADVLYKATDYHAPEFDRALLWNDPAIGIEWPLKGRVPTLSDRDKNAMPLARCELVGVMV
jgi:dTDP-4-dehydrorhamnose 3,5-epimerase